MKFTGLTSAEAEASRAKYGANTIPEPAWMTFGQAFRATFRDPMIRILLVMVVLMIAMYFAGHAEIYEPVGTIVTVILVATVTARTNVASDTEYRALRARTAKETAKVCRDGGLVVLPVDDIVVGDHVILQGGNKIPADGMLIAGDLRVNNTALNGETEECPKIPADSGYVFPEEITGDTFVDDASLFRGAVVFDGEGVMEVHRVGVETMMGRMASEMQAHEPDSPLQVKLAKLADQISAFGYISGVAIISLYMMFFVLRAGGLEAYVMLGWSPDLRRSHSGRVACHPHYRLRCARGAAAHDLARTHAEHEPDARARRSRAPCGRHRDGRLAEHSLQRQDGNDHGRASRGCRFLHGGRHSALSAGARAAELSL